MMIRMLASKHGSVTPETPAKIIFNTSFRSASRNAVLVDLENCLGIWSLRRFSGVWIGELLLQPKNHFLFLLIMSPFMRTKQTKKQTRSGHRGTGLHSGCHFLREHQQAPVFAECSDGCFCPWRGF